MSSAVAMSDEKKDPATLDVQSEDVKLNSPQEGDEGLASESHGGPAVDCLDRDPNQINDHVKVGRQMGEEWLLSGCEHCCSSVGVLKSMLCKNKTIFNLKNNKCARVYLYVTHMWHLCDIQ